MNIIINFLHLLGFNNITAESDIIILYCASIFVLSLLALLCFINLIIYFITIIIIDSKRLNNYVKVLDTKIEKLKILKYLPVKIVKILKIERIVQFYRNIRVFYIILEVVLLLLILLTFTYSSYIIISA